MCLQALWCLKNTSGSWGRHADLPTPARHKEHNIVFIPSLPMPGQMTKVMHAPHSRRAPKAEAAPVYCNAM